MTGSYQPDLDQATLTARLGALQDLWRRAAEIARANANDRISDEARYWEGYADMADRAVQALRGLDDQW